MNGAPADSPRSSAANVLISLATGASVPVASMEAPRAPAPVAAADPDGAGILTQEDISVTSPVAAADPDGAGILTQEDISGAPEPSASLAGGPCPRPCSRSKPFRWHGRLHCLELGHLHGYGHPDP